MHLPAQPAPCSPSDELEEIHAADQEDREEASIDWSIVGPRDRERRERVAELMTAGEVRCPADLYRAAMVYQHGRSPQHFLLAHILAGAAAFQGYEPALRLSASTLDRYLRNTAQAQVFGTQRNKYLGETDFTDEPFDRQMLPDWLRALYNLPSLAEMESELERLNNPDQP